MTEKSGPMILESIVTSVDSQGRVNVAPMGPQVDRELTKIVLRPFKSSTTFGNLEQTNKAVVHVVDDVLLLARAAIGHLHTLPAMHEVDDGWWVIDDACRWFAVEIDHWKEDALRPSAQCIIRRQGTNRDFFGLNRAKHAVVEAAILATRTHILPASQIQEDLVRLQPLIDKTGGDAEAEAFEMIRQFVGEQSQSESLK